ncbi:MAG: aminopeptidase P family protein [Gemmatimonadetes bacterium]|nr:aminopeptidase P family protein [Gemmatimonadota bacterium]
MSPDLRDARREALVRLLESEGLDGLIVTHLPNVRYLTGFTGSAAVLFLLGTELVLISDFRYRTQAESEVGEAARIEIVSSDVWGRAWRVLGEYHPVPTLGFEADAVTVQTAQRFDAAEVRSTLRPVVGLVERLRAAKHPSEVAAIREAARLATDAFEDAVRHIRPGVTEREVAAQLEYALRLRGSEWHPFATIVASGKRSALPHARTGTRRIEAGDLVLVDFGAQLDGYCADLSRTVVIGRPDERQRTIYDLVREAQRGALSAIRAGMTGQEADALARSVIASRGFGDAFGHSLGHGLGLEVHEAPRVSATNEDTLPENAVVTIEPGIYLPGWGGIRIEDDVHLTAEGAVLLSDGQTEFRELG